MRFSQLEVLAAVLLCATESIAAPIASPLESVPREEIHNSHLASGESIKYMDISSVNTDCRGGS